MVGNLSRTSRIKTPGSIVKGIKMRKSKGVEVKEPERLDAAPLSSDDEDEDGAYHRGSDHEESDNERQQAADIRPSFRTTSSANPPTTANARQGTEASVSQTTRQVGSKRSANEMGQDPSSHFTNVFGFTTSVPKKLKNKSSRSSLTYGKNLVKSARVAGTRNSSSQDNSPPKPKFQTFAISPSPPQKPKGLRKDFRRPTVSPSVEDSPAKTGFQLLDNDDSPVKLRRSFFNNSDSDAPGTSSTNFKSRKQVRSAERPRNASKAKRKSPNGSPEGEALAPFKLPDMEGLDDIDDDSKPVMSTQALGLTYDPEEDALDLDSSLSSLDDDDDDVGGTRQKSKAVCPMCREPVDPELLQKHLAGGRMNVRKQTAFCRLHKRKEAQDAQREKGYPEVDWATIESRFGKHEAALEAILEGQQASPYAARLAEQVDAGESRTLLKAAANGGGGGGGGSEGGPPVPGYYGPRGARVMAEHITKRFAGTIRRRAVADRLIAARGHTAYVQAVLVPELAVRLIMDDLGVDAARARAVMLESSGFGELVAEETRDVVRWSDDEEHEQELEQQRRSREDSDDEDTLDEE